MSRARGGVRSDGPSGLPLWHRVVAGFVRFVLSSLARVRVEGIERVPRTGPLIIIGNHTSNADPPLVGAWLLPALGRPVHWLAKEQLFVGPVGRFLRSQNVHPVRAGGTDTDAYRFARSVLDGGGVICIFPEGTRSPDGRLGEARRGVTLLAARSRVPVLPVGLLGPERFLPRQARLPRLGTRIVIRVGQPFTIDLDPALDRRTALARATDELMGHVAALLPAERRGRYGAAADAVARSA